MLSAQKKHKVPLLSFRHNSGQKETTESGLTLIECLVAIAIIGLTSATIAPVFVLSVATRVQNQKAEQALQIARGEIDRVKLIVERQATYTDADLKLSEVSSVALGSSGTLISSVNPPDSGNSIVSQTAWLGMTNPISALDVREVDSNQDGAPDFLVQSFRGEAVTVTNAGATMPVAFDMGVRVYDYNATTNNGEVVSGLETESAGLGLTSGEGQRGRRPLAVMYTQITNSDNPASLCAYMEYLGETIPANMSCTP